MKIIPQYPQYFVSESGDVYSTLTNRFLTIQTHKNGYRYTTLSNDGVSTKFLVHRLVAQAYLGLDLFSDLEVHHKDELRSNNEVSNLEVLSREEHLQITLNAQGKNRRTIKEPLVEKPMQISVDIAQEDIEFWVLNYSWTRAQKELGMSDNGLRKRYKRITGKDPKGLKKSKKLNKEQSDA